MARQYLSLAVALVALLCALTSPVTCAPSPEIARMVAVLSRNPNYSMFVKVVSNKLISNHLADLIAKGPVTLLAPNNAAINTFQAKNKPGPLDSLQVVRFHCIPRQVTARGLVVAPKGTAFASLLKDKDAAAAVQKYVVPAQRLPYLGPVGAVDLKQLALVTAPALYQTPKLSAIGINRVLFPPKLAKKFKA